MSGLVLSLFPGIDLLGRAFEAEGFCVVRGPDPIFGGDVHDFHPPAGRFDGLIGGPPCKGESSLAHLNGAPGRTLRHEFFRVRDEARPAWWVMEAVVAHEGDWFVTPLNNRWLGQEQSRMRYFHSNLPLHRYIETEVFEAPTFKHAVLAGHGSREGSVMRGMATYSLAEACRLQGLPETFDPPFWTKQGKKEAVGNGVPLPMGRAIAKAVIAALTAPGVRSQTDKGDSHGTV